MSVNKYRVTCFIDGREESNDKRKGYQTSGFETQIFMNYYKIIFSVETHSRVNDFGTQLKTRRFAQTWFSKVKTEKTLILSASCHESDENMLNICSYSMS